MSADLLVKEIQTKDYRIKIEYDDCSESPRIFNDNLGHMVFWHRRYNLGDKHNYDADNFFYELAEELGIETEFYNEKTEEWEYLDKEKVKVLVEEKVIIYQVSMTDHSNISLYMGSPRDRWDSGILGFTYVTLEEVEKEYGVVDAKTIKQAKEILEAELETYNMYVNGEIYWCLIEKINKCECCGQENYDEVDSCGGFYGYNFRENGIWDMIKEAIDDKETLEKIEIEIV